ncbi:MAG: ferritin family protein [Deltaproteobacteria bacterium]|nr:ferritin family protein [Deltaproteobacteria bacterium]
MVFFSAGEVIEIAIQIEKNGLSFYRSLAKSTDQEDLRSLFNHLASEEEIHLMDFQSLYDSLKTYQPHITDEEEYYGYIKMLADMNIFTKKEGVDSVIKKIKELEEALDVAIGFEKDSIIFYTELIDLVQGSQKKAVKEIIRQEKGHLRKLFLMAIEMG